jgi:phytoene/squalene synthetase
MDSSLSPVAGLVRKFDRDRFATALFAPGPARERLFALYALNIELANIRTQVREPQAGLIRLQWWREVLDGGRDAEARPHPVAWAARQLGLEAQAFEPLLTAREFDLEPAPFADLAAIEDYAHSTAGCLSGLACRLLDADGHQAALRVGTAFALVGLARALPFHHGTGWSALPGGAKPDKAATLAALAPITRRAAELLDEAQGMGYPRAALPVLLAGTQARLYLRVLAAAGGDPFDSRIARLRPMPLRLLWHAWRGRF